MPEHTPQIFRYLIIIFKIFGFWRQKISNVLFYKILYILFLIVSQIGFFSFGAGLAAKLIDIYFHGYSVALFDVLMFFCSFFTLMSRNILVLTHGTQHIILRVVKEEKKTFEENIDFVKKIFERSTIFLRRILNFLLVSTLFTILGLFLANSIQYVNHRNDLDNKPLPSPTIWYPFDENEHYFSTLLISIIQPSCCYGVHVVGNSTIVALMIYAKTELTVLNTCMRNLHLHRNTEDEIFQNLRKLAIKHQRIIKFVEELSMMIRFVILIDFCVTTIVIATSVFQMIYLHTSLVTKMFQVFLIVSEWFQIFSVSWFANEIRIESTELSGALYETKWYNYSPRIKQLISIMMVRSQKPLTMHIGPFDVLTINAGLRALRATYSYITLFLVMAPTEEN